MEMALPSFGLFNLLFDVISYQHYNTRPHLSILGKQESIRVIFGSLIYRTHV